MSEEQILKTEETQSENAAAPNKKKKISWKVAVPIIIAAVLAVGIGVSMLLFITGVINPYEKDYIDVTGRTAADLAKSKNLKYDRFLKEYGLPEDMPKSTSERAVYYNIPVGVFVKKTPGIDSFEALKESMGWDDSITEDTTMGDALDKTKLYYYVGEFSLERFKVLYELPETVTGDTLYGEIRNIVDAKDKEFREADESMSESEQSENPENTKE